MTTEAELEKNLIGKPTDLKYTYRPDIRDGNRLLQIFKEKFEALNRVHLSQDEFNRLVEKIISPDIFVCSRNLRERETFIRDDGTPLQYIAGQYQRLV